MKRKRGNNNGNAHSQKEAWEEALFNDLKNREYGPSLQKAVNVKVVAPQAPKTRVSLSEIMRSWWRAIGGENGGY